MEREVDVAIIGAGSAGLTAWSQVRRRTDNWVLIDGGELGTTCARVGCMPSKALIQIAEDMARREVLAKEGIEGGEALRVDRAAAMERVEDLRDLFVDQVLATSIDELSPEQFIESHARFVSPTELEVEGGRVRARRVIIATGSRPLVPAPWQAFGDRVLTTDDFFELDGLPDRMAVIGLGVIGLELGQALARLGIEVTGFDLAGTIGGLTDPVVAAEAAEVIGKEFPLHLGRAAEVTEAGDGALRVSNGEVEVTVDKVLVAIGRTPNVESLGLENLGCALDDRGIPLFDPHTLQVGDLPVFIAGDVTGTRPILHEANHEGRIAGYNACAERPRRFARKTPFTIVFSDPNIVEVGASLAELEGEDIVIGEGSFRPLGRALIMAKNKGRLRLYLRRRDGRLLGANVFAPKGEHLGHLLAWCIERGSTLRELLQMPFYHPTLEEGLQSALNSLKAELDLGVDYPPELTPLD
ncbi:dihydrolipoyl dehydrogenase [Thiohalobacter sp.]|uniref:dihydrolipoyl dehydrogenase n=1 Tax=Thiohalobacter sp. TaxID=2025948 RepID=UPI002637082D|nr:dihydrolipoyl dehydrogenase [Thiohalobacter sp.]